MSERPNVAAARQYLHDARARQEARWREQEEAARAMLAGCHLRRLSDGRSFIVVGGFAIPRRFIWSVRAEEHVDYGAVLTVEGVGSPIRVAQLNGTQENIALLRLLQDRIIELWMEE